jgi:hypothetical protein
MVLRYRLGMGVVLMVKELQRTLGLSHSFVLQFVGRKNPVRRLCLLHSVLVDHSFLLRLLRIPQSSDFLAVP